MENIFKKVHSPKDYIISGVLVAAGVALSFFSTGLGAVVCLCGILFFLLFKSAFLKEGENVRLRKKSVELSAKCLPSLMDFVHNKHNDPLIIPGNEGGTILMELWYNAKSRLVFIQLSDYKEIQFQKVTDIVQLSEEDAEKLLGKL